VYSADTMRPRSPFSGNREANNAADLVRKVLGE